MLTHQQIFDTSVLHLRKQGCKSGETGNCKYRLNGLGCGLAPFIPDSHYDQSLEGMIPSNLALQEAMPEIDWTSAITLEMMQDLQSVHDSYDVENWPKQWCKIAQTYNLNAYAVCKPL